MEQDRLEISTQNLNIFADFGSQNTLKTLLTESEEGPLVLHISVMDNRGGITNITKEIPIEKNTNLDTRKLYEHLKNVSGVVNQEIALLLAIVQQIHDTNNTVELK